VIAPALQPTPPRGIHPRLARQLHTSPFAVTISSAATHWPGSRSSRPIRASPCCGSRTKYAEGKPDCAARILAIQVRTELAIRHTKPHRRLRAAPSTATTSCIGFSDRIGLRLSAIELKQWRLPSNLSFSCDFTKGTNPAQLTPALPDGRCVRRLPAQLVNFCLAIQRTAE